MTSAMKLTLTAVLLHLTSLCIAFQSLDGVYHLAPSKRQYNIGPAPTDEPNAANGYISPGPGDVRSPCPALNTLANHGFLPRDGKNIDRETIQQAFVNGFNVGFSVTEVPKENIFNVCEYVTGQYCYTVDLNIIQTPHTFEHDHSLSREDYMEGYSPNTPADNHDFNGTIFQTTLNVLQGSSHMNFSQANEVRLQRESIASVVDKPGWFTLAQDTQETELGFIYAVMKDFNLPNYLTNPLVRVDWWERWFTYETFPTVLGWAPPTVEVEQSFVSSVSSAIRTNQRITSTPNPFASSFLKERRVATATDAVTPTEITGVPKTVNPTVLSSVQESVGARPTMANPYSTVLAAGQWRSQAAAIESNVAAVQSALVRLL